MKDALGKESLKPYLMVQPLGFLTPEVNSGDGYCDLPETFLGTIQIFSRFQTQTSKSFEK